MSDFIMPMPVLCTAV